jgi:hypothetical protein
MLLVFSPRPANSTVIRKYRFEAAVDHFANTAGQLETQETRGEIGQDFQSGDDWRLAFTNNYEHLDEPFEISKGLYLPMGSYRFNHVDARYQIGPSRRINGTITAGGGQFYNGTRTQVGYRGRVELSSRLAVEPGLSFNWVDLVEGSFLAKLLTARLTYGLSPRQSASALVQYNSAGHVIGANLRYRWEFKPGSDLFVVYNEGRDTTLGVSRAELRNRMFAVKFTRLFRF